MPIYHQVTPTPALPPPPRDTHTSTVTKVRITSDGTSNGTRIEINDKELDNVVDVTWSIKPNGLARVTLTLLEAHLDVDGQMQIDFKGTLQ